jgi:hypothetical protein
MNTHHGHSRAQQKIAIIGIITICTFLFLSIYMFVLTNDEDVLVMGAIGILVFLLFISALAQRTHAVMFLVLLLLSILCCIIEQYASAAIMLMFAFVIAVILLFKNSR